MTNREKYGERLLDHLEEYGAFPALVNGRFIRCSGNECEGCAFDSHCREEEYAAWLKAEYTPQPDIPLNTLIDTPIWVWDGENPAPNKCKRHFAGFEDGKHMVMAWDAGKTSWTADGIYVVWDHAELAIKEDTDENLRRRQTDWRYCF